MTPYDLLIKGGTAASGAGVRVAVIVAAQPDSRSLS